MSLDYREQLMSLELYNKIVRQITGKDWVKYKEHERKILDSKFKGICK